MILVEPGKPICIVSDKQLLKEAKEKRERKPMANVRLSRLVACIEEADSAWSEGDDTRLMGLLQDIASGAQDLLTDGEIIREK